jgi:hypothetical protein
MHEYLGHFHHGVGLLDVRPVRAKLILHQSDRLGTYDEGRVHVKNLCLREDGGLLKGCSAIQHSSAELLRGLGVDDDVRGL